MDESLKGYKSLKDIIKCYEKKYVCINFLVGDRQLRLLHNCMLELDTMEDTHDKKISKHLVHRFDIWALGITLVIGGQYFKWNAGLSAGFGSYLIAMVLMGTSYCCLCLCVSEISSALPFAGGAYGLARCTLGFYLGYLIGCFETFEYIIYIAVSALGLGELVVAILPSFNHYQPIVWLIFYLSALLIHIIGGRIFWSFNRIMAVASITILLIYIFGSMSHVHFHEFSLLDNNKLFRGGIFEFVQIFPVTAWFYVGVEALNFACDDTINPRRDIPAGQISCILTLNVTAVLVLFMSCSQFPGIKNLRSDLNPLQPGE